MLSQQLLSMASQSIKVVTSQLTHCQRLERSIEVMCTLKAQQSLFKVTPSSDLWLRAEGLQSRYQHIIFFYILHLKKKKRLRG